MNTLALYLTENREHSWIDCVSNFAKLLRTAPASSNTRPVKVAIIDDGVDASLLSLDSKIAIGKSFCPYVNSTDLMSRTTYHRGITAPAWRP
ncbi:hypothetical protein F4823DRAFT_592558 [Ustulina deusta]|nr:hypothetical protein F4823DRAFT_592558 [Ustulina deusta]